HRFIERSSLFSDLFTAVVLALVLAHRVTPNRSRYALPFIFLLWANLHPGFLTGLAICVAAVLWDVLRVREPSVRNFALCVAASGLSCVANPGGISGMLYPLRPFFDPSWQVYREHNYEWMRTFYPPYAGSPAVIAFYFIVLIGLVLAIVALPRRPWFELTVLVMLTGQGLSAFRFVPTASFSLAVLGTGLAARTRFLT